MAWVPIVGQSDYDIRCSWSIQVKTEEKIQRPYGEFLITNVHIEQVDAWLWEHQRDLRSGCK